MRTSSLRGLGAWANVFAIESFIDELAEIAGEDPVSYRLSLLSDPRARRVVETAARMSGWFEQPQACREGRARGFGFARYKNIASFAAVVVEVEVDEEIRLKKVWCAADAGLVIAPDGAREPDRGRHHPGRELRDARAGPLRGWPGRDRDLGRLSDPALFSDIPEIEIELIDNPNEPTLGSRRSLGRPDRSRDRQCARPRARQAHPRFAADAGADHGYAAGGIKRNLRKLH